MSNPLEIKLPANTQMWDYDVSHLSDKQQKVLEDLIGYKQENQPRADHLWQRIEDYPSKRKYLFLFERTSQKEPYSVAAIIRLPKKGDPVTSSELRGLPITTFARDMSESSKWLIQAAEILGNKNKTSKYPFTPLPSVNLKSHKFLSKVAQQYIYFKTHNPEANPVVLMAAHDNKSKPTIQRWLAAARKNGILPKIPRGGR